MFSYTPLQLLLVKKGMTKTQLRQSAGFGTATLAKISKNEYISMKNLDDICKVLNCRIDEVIEYIPDASDEQASD